MKIIILCVGKIKEKYFVDAINEYSKRLTKYIKLEIVELQDEKTPDNNSELNNIRIKEIEGERILKRIKPNSLVVALDIQGKNLSSEEFSKFIEKQGIIGTSTIYFIIGGSLGLSENVLQKSKVKISFSKMTFPHQLMRVILLEQIYRSFKIMKNEPYHK